MLPEDTFTICNIFDEKCFKNGEKYNDQETAKLNSNRRDLCVTLSVCLLIYVINNYTH